MIIFECWGCLHWHTCRFVILSYCHCVVLSSCIRLNFLWLFLFLFLHLLEFIRVRIVFYSHYALLKQCCVWLRHSNSFWRFYLITLFFFCILLAVLFSITRLADACSVPFWTFSFLSRRPNTKFLYSSFIFKNFLFLNNTQDTGIWTANVIFW